MHPKALNTYVISLAVCITFAALAVDRIRADDSDDDSDSDSDSDEITITGVAVTGANRRLGEPVWDLGVPFGLCGFNFVFGFVPGGGNVPIDLDPSTPLDTLVATGFDTNLAVVPPFAPFPDPTLLNIPFREVPIIVGPDGTRAPVPSVLDVPGFAPSKSLPNAPITLGEWLEAEGKLDIECDDDGTAIVKVKLKNLIENGVYTLWGVFGLDLFPVDGMEDTIVPVALGGVPNVMIADEDGEARIKRTINFCPIDEPRLKTINIAWHSDGSDYGAVPELPLLGLPGGVITHDQVNFAINVAGLAP